MRKAVRLSPAFLIACACAGGPPAERLQAPPPAPLASEPPADQVDRTRLPVPGEQVEWAPAAPVSWQLGNEVRVLFARTGSTPVVSLNMIIPRGAAHDPNGKEGLTHLMADLLDEGAGDLGALELSEALQMLATDYSAHVDVDFTLLSMDLLAENFQRSVELLADIVQRPKFTNAEFKRGKERALAEAINDETEPRTAQRAARVDALFGDGYAGHLSRGSKPSIERISPRDIKQQYSALMVAEGVQFAVAGNIDKEVVDAALSSSFEAWGGTPKSKERGLQEPPMAGQIYLVDFPGAAQSVVSVLKRAEGSQAKDLFAAMVFNRAWGGAFTARVNMNLREDKGYTYGARSGFERYKKAGFFTVTADVRSNATRASVDEMLKELELLCGSKPLSVSEHQDSVSGILLGYPGRFEKVADYGGQLAELAAYERPLDWYQTYPSRVGAVTLEAANAVARRNCDEKDFSIVIAGDGKRLNKTLASLGRPIVGYDHQGFRLK